MADSARIKLLVEYAEQGDFTPPLALTYDMPTYEPSEPQEMLHQKVTVGPQSTSNISLPEFVQLVIVRNCATGVAPDDQALNLTWRVENGEPEGQVNFQDIPPGGFVALGGSVLSQYDLLLYVASDAPIKSEVLVIGRQDPL